ncbi:MAG TPA: hypothetical protein VGI40_09490 [Pirellulaceae bacterium]|jgi:hypothetical protein
MTEAIRNGLDPVHRRQQQLRALWFAALGLFASAAILVAFVIVRAISGWHPMTALIWGVAIGGPAIGFIAGSLLRRKWREAAIAVDVCYGFKDRILTALDFLGRGNINHVQRLAVDDAIEHLNRVNPLQVVPDDSPRVLPSAVVSMAVAILLLVYTTPPTASAKAMVALPEIVDSADRAAEELKSLEEFAREEQDAEIEKLVSELKQAIEQLKQPGIEPREALAKLSAMQSAIEQQQAKFNMGQVDAQLQAIGNSLALASAMAEAGNALSSKQYEKAAEELEKLDLPQLDRQTEKAIKEKLDALARQMQDSGSSSLGATAGELSQGLGGDGKRFKRSLNRLAMQVRNQAKRTKLNDLLKKQCDCLCECKELKWGKAASGNPLGEETPKFGGQYESRLTGRQSDQGEIEVETTHSPEGKQNAQREYRTTYDKYRKISEAVLDSEPIPLGHRQTIRRYFEAIRPTDAETDATQAAAK